jgi:hypothetical protein
MSRDRSPYWSRFRPFCARVSSWDRSPYWRRGRPCRDGASGGGRGPYRRRCRPCRDRISSWDRRWRGRRHVRRFRATGDVHRRGVVVAPRDRHRGRTRASDEEHRDHQCVGSEDADQEPEPPAPPEGQEYGTATTRRRRTEHARVLALRTLERLVDVRHGGYDPDPERRSEGLTGSSTAVSVASVSSPAMPSGIRSCVF